MKHTGGPIRCGPRIETQDTVLSVRELKTDRFFVVARQYKRTLIWDWLILDSDVLQTKEAAGLVVMVTRDDGDSYALLAKLASHTPLPQQPKPRINWRMH